MKEWGLKRSVLLQDDEWNKLRRHLDREALLAKLNGTSTAVQDRVICYMAVWTGLRRSELANLRVDDLLLKNDHPFIVVRHGKGDKYREVLISPLIRRLLKQFVKDRGLEDTVGQPLFRPQRTPQYTPNGIYRVWRTACHAAGIPTRSIHKARHYYGLKQYEASNDLRLVQKQLGHSRVTTTQVYVDVSAASAQEDLTALDKSLTEAG